MFAHVCRNVLTVVPLTLRKKKTSLIILIYSLGNTNEFVMLVFSSCALPDEQIIT